LYPDPPVPGPAVLGLFVSVDLHDNTLIFRDPEKPESSGVLLLVVSSLLDPASFPVPRAVLPLNASLVVGVEAVCFFSLGFFTMFPTEFLLGLWDVEWVV